MVKKNEAPKKDKTHEEMKAQFAKAKPRTVKIKGKTFNAQVRITRMKPPVAPQPAPPTQ